MSKKADYGFGARVLHHFALTSRMVSEMSFQIEQGLYPTSSKKAREGEHVFVTALARAGTTALMRLLYETGEFCSLTYREMPFPLAPRLWRKISSTSAQKGELSERAHGDGILVDFDSPEALEEVFWRVFSGKSYIASDRLTPMKAAPETIEAFRKYIADLLELSGAKRYLKGKRFVAATELEEGQKLATAVVKQVTGGEKITADRKHEHEISFWPTHKLWFSGNHKPRISDTTESIWRRVKLIPFNYKIPSQSINSDLVQLFVNEEAPGILAWAVLGCLEWQNVGLITPGIINDATTKYRSDEDKLSDFILECCVIEPIAKCYTSNLYKEYQEWCNTNGEKPFGKQRFNERIQEKGFLKGRGSYNKPEWSGLGIKYQEKKV
ncbi:MAG: phage/plasmid primase, P4 family [Spirochaetia bacterium]